VSTGRRTECFLARQGTDQAPWLVRILTKPEERPAFEREVERASVFGTAPPIGGAVEYDGAVVAATRPIVSESLATILGHAFDSGEPVDMDVALAIAMGIAAQLQDGSDGRLHADLVPRHVLVGYDGAIHLIDPAGEDGLSRASLPSRRAYRSPEHVRGASVGPASDVFGLGVLTFEMTTATPLYELDADADVERAIVAGRYPRPRNIRGDSYPIELQVVLRKLLRGPTDGRFSSAAAALEGLRLVSTGRPDAKGQRVAAWMHREFPLRFSAWKSAYAAVGHALEAPAKPPPREATLVTPPEQKPASASVPPRRSTIRDGGANRPPIDDLELPADPAAEPTHSGGGAVSFDTVPHLDEASLPARVHTPSPWTAGGAAETVERAVDEPPPRGKPTEADRHGTDPLMAVAPSTPEPAVADGPRAEVTQRIDTPLAPESAMPELPPSKTPLDERLSGDLLDGLLGETQDEPNVIALPGSALQTAERRDDTDALNAVSPLADDLLRDAAASTTTQAAAAGGAIPMLGLDDGPTGVMEQPFAWAQEAAIQPPATVAGLPTFSEDTNPRKKMDARAAMDEIAIDEAEELTLDVDGGPSAPISIPSPRKLKSPTTGAEPNPRSTAPAVDPIAAPSRPAPLAGLSRDALAGVQASLPPPPVEPVAPLRPAPVPLGLEDVKQTLPDSPPPDGVAAPPLRETVEEPALRETLDDVAPSSEASTIIPESDSPFRSVTGGALIDDDLVVPVPETEIARANRTNKIVGVFAAVAVLGLLVVVGTVFHTLRDPAAPPTPNRAAARTPPPAPTAPEPAAPEPEPEAAAPEPVPEPAAPEPAEPEPAEPELALELVEPEPAPEPIAPEPAPEAAEPEPAPPPRRAKRARRRKRAAPKPRPEPTEPDLAMPELRPVAPAATPVDTPKPAPKPAFAVRDIRVRAFPKQARIFVDGVEVANGAVVAIGSKPRVVRIEADGYQTLDTKLEPGREKAMTVVLKRRPKDQ